MFCFRAVFEKTGQKQNALNKSVGLAFTFCHVYKVCLLLPLYPFLLKYHLHKQSQLLGKILD